MVFEADREGRLYDVLLFHQLSAMHDDDIWHRRVVLPESILSRFANGVWPSCGEATPTPTPLIRGAAGGTPA
jgi:hypothetical protein